MSTLGASEPPIRGCLGSKVFVITDQVGSNPGDSTAQATQHGQAVPSPANTIDVDAIEDDVVELSRTAFAEAQSKPGRIRKRRTGAVVPGHTTTSCGPKRKRGRTNSSKAAPSVLAPPPPPPAPKEPPFSCPICFNPPSEEMSTKCGHIFCKACITTAIAKRGLCPTCRTKVTVKGLIRVYLPTAH